MENEKKPELLNDDGWLDEILGPQSDEEKIVAEEEAAQDAGLMDPNDLELEMLLAEFGSEAAGEDEAVPEALAAPQEEPLVSANPVDAEAPFQDEEFRDAFGTGETLEEAFAAPAELTPESDAPETPAEPPAPPKKKRRWWKKETPEKRRPIHKKGYGFFGIPHILSTFVWLALAVVIGTTAGNVMWMLAADVLAFNQVPKTVTITITGTEGTVIDNTMGAYMESAKVSFEGV